MTLNERALEFVMGSLSPLERDAVARDRLSDPALDGAIRALEADLSPLTGLAGTSAPSAELFDRIAEALAEERASLADKVTVPFDDGEWQEIAPGVESRELWSHRAYLLRCSPGAIIRAHFHTESENLVVISGDLVIAGRIFRTGDWHSAPPGSHHDDIHTRHGCVVLIQHAV